MDISNWKRILMHWANQTGLFERTYYNMEQTDVDLFYEAFRGRMKTTPIEQMDLALFIKEQYPEIELHLDDENNISSSDYMYIYSLLLHYSCVKCPEPYFHEVCQTLPETFQQAIASFFKYLLANEISSKETLRQAISSSSPKSPIAFVPFVPTDSPIRTPRSKISPPTPKTSMIEERTKELNLLKAHLESERYEKGFLELQLKQNEERIHKLTQEQKAHLAEIYNLKNELLVRNTDDYSPKKSSEIEQIKKRLRKNIEEKEETILNLRENLETLGEEKSLLNGKLSYAEKQVNICLERIKEMDYVINDLKSEVEKRNLAIQSLTETKNELELFISESRSSSQGCRNDLNMSAECLDVSLSRTTNSSASILSSPENLGVSVVDIKLREKEIENSTLCEQIEQMKADSSKLTTHVRELIGRYAETFDICNENSVLVDNADLPHTFMVFENYVEKMVMSYIKTNEHLQTVKAESAEMQVQNASLVRQVSDLEQQLGVCRRQVESLQSDKLILEQKYEFCLAQCQKYQEDINRLDKKHLDVQLSLTDLYNTYESTKQTYEERMTKLTTEKSMIESQLKTLTHDLDKLTEGKSTLEKDNENFEKKISQFMEDLDEKTKKIHEFEEINGNLLVTIGIHVQEIRRHEEKINDLEENVVKFEKTIEILNEEKHTLLKETNETRSNLDFAKNSIEKLKTDYEQELETNTQLKDENTKLTKLIGEKEKELQNLTSSKNELESKLANSTETIQELNATVTHLKESRDHFEDGYEKMNENITLLNAQLAEKSETIAKKESDYQNCYQEKENELKNIRNAYEASVVNYDLKIQSLDKQIQDLTLEQEKLGCQITKKDTEIQSLNLDIQNLRQENTALTDRFTAEKQDLEQKNTELISRNSEIETEMISILSFSLNNEACNNGSGQGDQISPSAIENPMKCLKERIATLLASNSELEKSGVELRSVISDLNDQIIEIKKSSEDLNGICKTFAEEIGQSESKVKCLEAEKSLLVSKVDELDLMLKQSELKIVEERAKSDAIIKELDEKWNSLSEDKVELLAEKASLEARQKDLVSELGELRITLTDHVNNESDLKEKLIFSEKQLTDSNGERLQLQKSLEEKVSTIDHLKQENNTLNEQLSKLRQAVSDDQSIINDLQRKIADLIEQVNELKNAHTELKTVNRELELSLEQSKLVKRNLEEVEVSLQEALKEISELNESKAVLQANQRNLEEAAIDRELKMTEMQEVIVGHENKIKDLEESILQKETNLKSKISNLELSLSEKEDVIEQWRQILQSADEESKELIKKHSNAVDALNSRIQSLENDRAALESTNKALQDNLAEMEESLKHAQSVNVELLSKVDELKSSNHDSTQRETDYINLQLKYVATCAEKERLMCSKQKLEENSNKLNKRVEKLSIKLGDLQADMDKLGKVNKEASAEIETLQKALQQSKARGEEWQSKFEATEQDLKEAYEEISILQRLNDKELAKCVTLDRELEKLRNQIAHEKPTLERDLKVANEKVSNLQTLYNEEVAKTVKINNELQQTRILLESKEMELKDQTSFLRGVKSDLDKKLETITKINAEFGEIKHKNERLQEENKLLIGRVQLLNSTEAELAKTQNSIKILESENSSLKVRLEELSNTEENLKEATSHIDNIKHELELKVEKLSTTLEKMSISFEASQRENETLEKENSELKSNIKALHEIVCPINVKTEEKTEFGVEESIPAKYNSILQNISELKVNKQSVEEEHSKLSSQFEASREENSQLTDKLSKLSLKLQILEKQNIELTKEITDLQTACDALQSEKEDLKKENSNSRAALLEMESRQNEILHDHLVSQTDLKEQLQRYEKQLDGQAATIGELEQQLNRLKDEDKTKARDFASTSQQLDDLEKKCLTLEQQVASEQEQNEKFKKDISIFQAKLFKNRQITEEKEKQWQEERNKLKEEIRKGEERIKDNRLELEGKLEKMKNKMKTLYNEEVTKIKTKHEREIVEYKAKVEGLVTKNEKYEQYVQKLAKQVFNLNETILELQKQNRFMETKLKDLESIPSSTLRRQSQFASQMIGSNLRMEDEEGELFNNTYLADLKSGRGSPFGRESVSASELHYRNSLAPLHLRSTYLAQYPEHNLREEDIKDVPVNLDDSLSSLLHAGQRKKISGTTSYKKPGPPTPSKNGGRLSFGSGNEPMREILKESNDISVSNSKKMATPSKFRTMFSSYKMKDELLTLLLDRNAKHRKSKKPVSRPLHNQFTSTPRKSRVYFDQRRHLEDFIQTGGRGGGTSGDANQHNNNGNINLIVAPTKCMQSEKFTKWRQSMLPSTDSCTTSDSNSPCVAEKDDSVFVETVEKVFIQKRKDRRSSFILRGNMFAKRKRDANNSSARELLRNKAKHQRSLHFNKYRKSLCGERYVKLRKSILDRLSSINPSPANDVESYEERNRDSMQWGTRDSIEAHMVDGDSEMFENLLTLKKSNAPFEVTEMNLTPASSSRQTSLKTLYSGSVIKNRKIPHVNKTPVGDTSGSSKKNQITIVHILHNWDKLDIFVKTLLLICFFILALNILLGIRLAG